MKNSLFDVSSTVPIMPRWYDMIVVYGYEIYIPGDVNTANYINTLHDLNGMIEHPYKIYSLLTSVCNGWEEDAVSADAPFIIIGFQIEDLDECISQRYQLDQYLQDNPIFEGISYVSKAQFHCGIEWLPPVDSDVESDTPSSIQEEEEEEEEEEEDENLSL